MWQDFNKTSIMDGFFNKDGIAVIADIVSAIQQNKESLNCSVLS